MKDFFTKSHLINTILNNSRLNDYRFYLSNSLEKGYEVLSLRDFYSMSHKRDNKHLVLRHDVDCRGKSTRKMFEVERQMGVRSTYYFRFSTIDKDLIHEMISSGFEVGLHYETIADIIKENHFESKNQVDLKYARERFKEDVIRFEQIIDHKIVSCCSHGAPENSKLGISNNCILEGVSMSDYGLIFEAYDKAMYKNDIDVHIMDSTLLYNFGFAYKSNPISAVDAGYQNILFLSHPNHWYFSFFNRIKKLTGMLLGLSKYDTKREFKRIEV